jgi:uncharacterized protein
MVMKKKIEPDGQNPESRRAKWSATRSYLESNTHKFKKDGKIYRRHWNLFEDLIRLFGSFLKIFHLYDRGYKNAKNIVLRHLEICSPTLPTPFDGYRILHLTDLHLDTISGIEDIICEKINNLSYDLCILTGDYREGTRGGFGQIIEPMEKIVSHINAADGVLATLGNHDTYRMVDFMENLGVRVLANETVSIEKGDKQISVTGVDDVQYYYTPMASESLEESRGAFKIALVHSPELYDVAAKNGYDVYLCGHTHGGQICLPFGIPVVTHVNSGRRFSRGSWRYRSMKGYTNQGCGVVGIPIRFNSQAEITLITLKGS